jgi:hypothetical protein
MDRILQRARKLTAPDYERPCVGVETGTALGHKAELLKRYFGLLYTIELSPEMYARALKRLWPFDHLVPILGDSREWVPQFASISEPIFWYLDAHYCEGALDENIDVTGLAAKNAFPLWEELAAIAPRLYADIVVVDDVHCFGRPYTEYAAGYQDDPQNWGRVTQDAILEALGPPERIAESYVLGDVFVAYRTGTFHVKPTSEI